MSQRGPEAGDRASEDRLLAAEQQEQKGPHLLIALPLVFFWLPGLVPEPESQMAEEGKGRCSKPPTWLAFPWPAVGISSAQSLP